jgi:OHCU decarboxylase
MTFAEFNAANTAEARASLLRCCGSKRWAEILQARRPFPDLDALQAEAETCWWTLGPADWLEAFSAHPKIGQSANSRWSAGEQSGVASAPPAVLDRLAAANQKYENRFGWIFLVNATGKSAAEMLTLLEARLKNEAAPELRVAAAEQAKITTLRLNKLFEE